MRGGGLSLPLFGKDGGGEKRKRAAIHTQQVAGRWPSDSQTRLVPKEICESSSGSVHGAPVRRSAHPAPYLGLQKSLAVDGLASAQHDEWVSRQGASNQYLDAERTASARAWFGRYAACKLSEMSEWRTE